MRHRSHFSSLATPHYLRHFPNVAPTPKVRNVAFSANPGPRAQMRPMSHFCKWKRRLSNSPWFNELTFWEKKMVPEKPFAKKVILGEYLHDILVGWQKLKKDVLCVWRGKRFKIDLKVAKTIIFFVWVRRARYMGCVRRKIEVNKKWASLCSDWQKTQQRWPVFLACKTV